MKPDHSEISDELLNAFVDNQLESAEKGRILSLINGDPALQARVSEVWRLKQMVQHAYQDVRAPRPAPRRRQPWFTRAGQALAASLLLLVGATAGWFGNAATDDSRQREFRLVNRENEQERVILHLASADPARLRAALDDAEYLLAKAPAGKRPVQLEIITNDGGLALLRADVSPYADRIKAMRATHQNVKFIACSQAIEKLRGTGVQVQLLPDTEIAPSAIDQITARLKQGWLYVRA